MQSLIHKFGMQPHPEGGYYREVYRAPQEVNSPMHGEPRSALTHIYYLLQDGDLSRFHRVSHDEVWNYYAGAPLRLIETDGSMVSEVRLGPGQAQFSHVVRGGRYQAARSMGDYTLVGCTVAPGFDFADFTFVEPSSALARFIRSQHSHLTMFL